MSRVLGPRFREGRGALACCGAHRPVGASGVARARFGHSPVHQRRLRQLHRFRRTVALGVVVARPAGVDLLAPAYARVPGVPVAHIVGRPGESHRRGHRAVSGRRGAQCRVVLATRESAVRFGSGCGGGDVARSRPGVGRTQSPGWHRDDFHVGAARGAAVRRATVRGRRRSGPSVARCGKWRDARRHRAHQACDAVRRSGVRSTGLVPVGSRRRRTSRGRVGVAAGEDAPLRRPLRRPSFRSRRWSWPGGSSATKALPIAGCSRRPRARTCSTTARPPWRPRRGERRFGPRRPVSAGPNSTRPGGGCSRRIPKPFGG